MPSANSQTNWLLPWPKTGIIKAWSLTAERKRCRQIICYDKRIQHEDLPWGCDTSMCLYIKRENLVKQLLRVWNQKKSYVNRLEGWGDSHSRAPLMRLLLPPGPAPKMQQGSVCRCCPKSQYANHYFLLGPSFLDQESWDCKMLLIIGREKCFFVEDMKGGWGRKI